MINKLSRRAFFIVKNAYPTPTHHTIPKNTKGPSSGEASMSKKFQWILKGGPFIKKPLTQFEEPKGPPGFVKSQSNIKPKVNVFGSPSQFLGF